MEVVNVNGKEYLEFNADVASVSTMHKWEAACKRYHAIWHKGKVRSAGMWPFSRTIVAISVLVPVEHALDFSNDV